MKTPPVTSRRERSASSGRGPRTSTAVIAAGRSGPAEGTFGSRLLEELLEHVPAVLYVERADAGAGGRWWSPGIAELTGYPPESFFADPALWPSLRVDPSAAGSLGLLLARKGHDAFRIRRADGAVRRVRDEWRLTGAGTRCGILRDVTEPDVAETLGAVPDRPHGSNRDRLTGLHDRRGLQQRLERTLGHDRSAGLLLLDIDRFREINDALGHAAGDALLVRIARRLVAAVRATDVVARFAGDEFAVLLPFTDGDGALSVARTVERALSAPFVLDRESVAVAASIGVAFGGLDAERLLREADRAMVAAKIERRGIVLFDPALHHDTVEAGYSQLPELRRALEEGELVLHYQPWLNLRTGESVAVEALVRWSHPTRGLLPPADFLPLAEQSSLIREIDAEVLEMACRQAAAWRDAGLVLRVAINLSRPSLLSEEFPSILAATLIRCRLEGPEIELEITENGVLGDPEQAAWLAERLTALGVGLSIDDFGTGYSSLGQLRRMGVSTLKVDQAFVRDLTSSEDDQAIVETVVALGHRLGLNVVAEGVEDLPTLEYLRSIDVDDAQGFVISRPMPGPDVAGWIAAHGPKAASTRKAVPTRSAARKRAAGRATRGAGR